MALPLAMETLDTMYRRITELLKLNENGETSQSFRRQGSIRKVLPSVPDMDTQLNMSAKMIDRRTCTPKGNHSYAPFFLEYSLLAEYNLLHKQKLPGVYVIPAAQSQLQWFGVLFIRHGFYQEGIFRFTLHIPGNYPDGDAPRLMFNPSIFHPLINCETGELDIIRGFPKWRRNVNHIWQVLLFARRIFYKIDTNNPVNKEAAELFENDKDAFKQKVKESLELCSSRLYADPSNDDPHCIRFSNLDDQQYAEIRKKMLSLKKEDGVSTPKNSHNTGLSWVNQDSLQIFSKEKLAS